MRKVFNKGEKGFLAKILLGYTIVAIASIIFIIVLNLQASDRIKESILLVNHTNMEKFVTYTDTVIFEMKESCMSATLDEETLNYVKTLEEKKEFNAFARVELSDKLKAYYKDKFSDIFIYFPQDDYIVSSNRATLKADLYRDTYLGNGDEVKEQFSEILNYQKGYPTLGVLNIEGTKSQLYIVVEHTMDRTNERFVTCVMLSPYYSHNVLAESNIEQYGEAVLFDRDGKAIYQNNDGDTVYNLEDYTGSSEPYETEFDGEKYVVQVEEADAFRGYYALVTPKSLFWERLSKMQIFSAIVVLNYICVAAVLGWISGKKTYEPLGNFVESLREKKGIGEYDSAEIKEFTFLKEVFKDEQILKEKLYKEAKDAAVDRRKVLLHRLLDGVGMEELLDGSILHENGLAFPGEQFVVGFIRVEAGGSKSYDLSSFIVSNVFEEVFNVENVGYVMGIKENQHVFIVGLKEDAEIESVATAVETGKYFLENEMQQSVTIAYSDICLGIDQIKTAYENAKTAMEYRYIFGRGVTISYGQIKDREISYLNGTKDKIATMVNAYLDKEEEDAPKECVAKIVELCGIDEESSLETADCFKVDVMKVINSLCIQEDVSAGERRKYTLDLLNAETLKEFQEYLAYLLVAFRQYRLEKGDEREISVQTRQYVQAHFANPQMSLTYVAEAMNISPSYLTKLYKEKYDTSVVSEITRFRLEKAKELLTESKLSINEIAERTGFSNSNVFIKVYKKWEGVTPGEYRKLNTEK